MEAFEDFLSLAVPGCLAACRRAWMFLRPPLGRPSRDSSLATVFNVVAKKR